jgi:PIN domain nuclease of toxin-antitoxin system
MGSRAGRALKLVLDTHVLVQWIEGKTLSKGHRERIETANEDSPLRVSDISLWEIATLYELGRIRLDLPEPDAVESRSDASRAALKSREIIRQQSRLESTSFPAERNLV